VNHEPTAHRPTEIERASTERTTSEPEPHRSHERNDPHDPHDPHELGGRADRAPRAREPSGREGAAPRPRRARWALGALAALAALGAAGAVALSLGRATGQVASSAPPGDTPRADGASLVFGDAWAERAGIAVAPVEAKHVSPALRVAGLVTFDPEHLTAVGTRNRGLVRALGRVEGDPVKKGDVLGEVESAELGEAQAAVSVARAQRLAAEQHASREAELAKKRLTTARELEVASAELSERRALLGAAEQRVLALGGGESRFGVQVLRSPIDGTLVERHVMVGQSVSGGELAFRVANLDHLWVELDVFERNASLVRVGDPVEISRVGSPDEVRGAVAHVGEVVDPKTRAVRVRVEVDNSRRALRPGQSVTAVVRARPATSAPAPPVVPEGALTYVDGKATVFVEEQRGRVRARAVELGAGDGSHREVREGLSVGERVVVAGVFALKSELFR
jgi:cobalt-zinc-cadmium efflux system membrane fusion protein